MGRPPLQVGTAGTYRFYRTKLGWEATCKYRDYDGVVRYIKRARPTKNAARLALDLAVRDRVYLGGNADHTPDTLVEIVADAWIANLKTQGNKGLGTIQQYEGNLERCLKPGVGNLRIRELGTVAACERDLKTILEKRGPATAKTARSVLSGFCAYAARHNLIDSNPMRDTQTITVKKKPPVSLTNAEVLDLRIWLTYDDKAIRRDLPDLVAFMLATGLRISEASAIHWDDIDLDAGTVRLRGNVIRVKGVGLIIQEDESNKLKKRTPDLPRWCVGMLRRRRLAGATVRCSPPRGASSAIRATPRLT